MESASRARIEKTDVFFLPTTLIFKLHAFSYLFCRNAGSRDSVPCQFAKLALLGEHLVAAKRCDQSSCLVVCYGPLLLAYIGQSSVKYFLAMCQQLEVQLMLV